MRCTAIDTLPYVKAFDGEVPYADRAGWVSTPCRKDAIVVRYANGIIAEGYCDVHCDMKNLSKHPHPKSGWEIYSPAKHYGGCV